MAGTDLAAWVFILDESHFLVVVRGCQLQISELRNSILTRLASIQTLILALNLKSLCHEGPSRKKGDPRPSRSGEPNGFHMHFTRFPPLNTSSIAQWFRLWVIPSPNSVWWPLVGYNMLIKLLVFIFWQIRYHALVPQFTLQWKVTSHCRYKMGAKCIKKRPSRVLSLTKCIT